VLAFGYVANQRQVQPITRTPNSRIKGHQIRDGESAQDGADNNALDLISAQASWLRVEMRHNDP
jgi:hypothetical protein